MDLLISTQSARRLSCGLDPVLNQNYNPIVIYTQAALVVVVVEWT